MNTEGERRHRKNRERRQLPTPRQQLTQKERQQLMQKQRRRKREKIRFFSYAFMVWLLFAFFFFQAGKRQGMRLAEERIAGESLTVFSEGEGENTIKRASINQVQENGDGSLILVNKTYALPEDYEVELVLLPDGINRSAKEAYEPLCEMLAAGRREGLQFEICSSYRDVSLQERLFNEDVGELMGRGYTYEAAYREVEKETMPPGHSEHSTGLAFDLVALDYQLLDEKQEDTEESRWLREHCAEYGFILRYPEGKEEITGINYESWHFRYVGKEAAEYIMGKGITLEEYLGV